MRRRTAGAARDPGRWLGVAAMVLASPSPFVHPQETVAIGIVDSVSGLWKRAQDGAALVRGNLVYEGQTVTIGRATQGSIRIILFGSDAPWVHTCTAAAPCSGSYRPRAAGNEGRGFWSFLSSFFRSGRQLPPVLAGARSAGGAGPSHALLTSGDGGVDVTAALEDLEPGRYALRLIPAPGGSLDGIARTVERTVTVGENAQLRIPALRAGLWVLAVSDANGQRIGGTAVILVHDDAAADAGATWAAAREAADALRDADPVTRAALLAQTLYAIDAAKRGRN